MKILKCFFIILFILESFFSYSQKKVRNNQEKNNWFIELDAGIQISGIKGEDFISSNYSPLIRLIGGKWLNDKIAIQVGYQGRYFNTIENSDKRSYNFYFVEGILNVKNILKISNAKNRVYELIFHGGGGYFQNKYYDNSTIHGVFGASNNFLLANKIKLKIDIGAIIGWDIYQVDQDIVPISSIGLVYEF